MSKINSTGRSYRTIDITDLKRLAIIAQKDQVEFFDKYPNKWGTLYSGRALGIALCQGAALH